MDEPIEELEEWLIEQIDELKKKLPRWSTDLKIVIYTKTLDQLRTFILEERKP